MWQYVAMRVPNPLRPGDLVYAVAPSGPFDPVLGWRGLGWLAQRYQVQFDREMFRRDGYLAGHDGRRLRELQAALENPLCRAIVAMRGGYGANRIAHRLDWELLRADPKWIVGFSDITALHVEAAAVEVASLHAPMAATLGRGDASTRQAWLEALENPLQQRSYRLRRVCDGQARGRLFGGNLAVLHACAAAGRLKVPSPALLFLEDIGERPYRVDRYLSTLLAGGAFDTVAGVVLGQFTDCVAANDGKTVQAVLKELLQPLGIPVAEGLQAGHELPNMPLHLGSEARLDVGENATLELWLNA